MIESQPLDIALVGPAHPFRGGIAHFIEKMCSGFSDRGYRSAIYSFTRQYPELLFPGKTQYDTDGADPSLEIVHSIDTLNPLSWLRTAKRLRRRSPDVVIFKYWMPFFAMPFGSIARRVRSGGSRVVCIVDNVLPHERRPGDVLLTRYFLRSVDGFIVMSRKVEEDLAGFELGAPVRYVPHPTYENFGQGIQRDVARRRLGIDEADSLLLFFGFVRRYKGLHVLLEAMPEIISQLPTARLIVAGEFYDDEAEYRRLVDRHQLADHVRLDSDYIPDAEVATYFSAADVVVQPYVSATQSGVAQIAFNFDRPVITTDVGGLCETVQHGKTGLVVDPDSPEQISAAVIRFFEDRLGDEMSQNVATQKGKFSWDELLDAIEGLAAIPSAQTTGAQ